MSRHRAATSNSPAGTGLLTAAAGGCLGVFGVIVAMLLAILFAAASFGAQMGTTVGCVISLLIQSGVGGIAALRPNSPSVAMAASWCWNFGIPFSTLCAPIGVAMLIVPDQDTATWAGFGTGVLLIGVGWLLRRAVTSRRHTHPAVDSADSSTAAANRGD